MTITKIQPSFASGELSPAIFGRVDLAKYQNGASTLRNMFSSYRGGANSRAGTAFVGICRQGSQGQALNVSPPRIVTFAYNVSQGIAIEMGQNYFRFAANGSYILENPFAVTGATQADPCEMTSPGNNFVTGDEVYVSGVLGMTRLNGLSFNVSVLVPGSTFYLINPLDGAYVNTDTFAAYTGGGTVARIYTLGTPYNASDLGTLKFAQSADVMTITHPSYPPYDLARIESNYWTLTKTSFAAGIAAPGTISGFTSSTSSVTASFYYQFVGTAVDSTGQESVASPVLTIESVDIASVAGSIVINLAAVAGAVTYNFYSSVESYLVIPSAGALFGYIGQSFGPSITDTNISPDFSTAPPTHRNPFATSSLTGVVMTAYGSGYHQSTTTATVASPIGQNPSLTPVVINGGIQWVIVNNSGAGMTGGETITFYDSVSSTQASGQLTFSVNPSPGDTITLEGVVWTFASASAAYQTVIQASLGGTMGQLVTDLDASSDPYIVQCYYGNDASDLFIVFKEAGTVGNNFTLAASAATPSGPTLTGGSGSSSGSGAAAVIQVGPAIGTYPSCCAYFQQRRFYANSNNDPDTYWASQPGAFTNFDVSTPTVDSDAITGSPWSQQVNGIQWMLNMPGGLVIFTGLGAWQLSGGGGGLATAAAITPSSQVANPQAYNGCSPVVPPIAINYDILYVQEKGSIVRDLSYNFFANIYTGTDLTVLSNHLFDGYLINQWAWAEEPNKLLWCVRDDGVLLCLTYLKEQDVYAWSRHDTNGLYQSVCSVSEPPVNAPYFIVQRYIENNGNPVWVNMLERMDNRIWADQIDAWCVDAGLAYPHNYPNATITVSSAYGVPTLNQPTVIYGGANYSSTTYAELIDPTGSGATTNITISSGVVTGLTVTGTLTGYTKPVINIIDPTGLGSGAAVSIFSTQNAMVNATAAVFANSAGHGEAGDVIYMGAGGRQMVVTQFLSQTSLNVEILQAHQSPITDDVNNTPVPVTSGNWSIVAPVKTVYGLNHLEGMLVSILADGVVVQPQTVSGGSITLPVAASTIVIGLGFTAQLQTMYLDIQGQVTVQGRRKEIDSVVVRIASSGVPFEVGVDQPDASTQPGQVNVPWTNMTGVQGTVTGPGTPLQPYDFNSGDLPVNIFAQPGYTNGQIAVQQTRPLPMNILALMPWVRLGDDPDAGS